MEIRQVDPDHPDARRCLAAYIDELNERSEVPFDPDTGSTAHPDELRSPRGVMLVAYLDDAAVGCAALKHHADAPSDIKRMWVHSDVRGRGVGRGLLVELERLAAERGDSAVRLETNALLVEAIALYRSAGFVEVEPFNEEPFADHWFRKEL